MVHTNLGRALLPRAAVEAVVTAAMSYSDLEYSLARGERASRQDHVHDVLCTVTGAEDALAVNNNAAAVLLALAATARGGEVLVSRGQLVEIGDGFRIPDILRESGAELVEVGTTNRTYLGDFEAAWTESTGRSCACTPATTASSGSRRSRRWRSWRRWRTSAARCSSTTSAAAPSSTSSCSRRSRRWRTASPPAADIVSFSGDKLLGGPQAGIAVGRAAAIEAMRRHPLARALRIDKLDLAALDVVLRLYLDPARAVAEIPTLAALAQSLDEVRDRAGRLRDLFVGAGVPDGPPRARRHGRPRRRRGAAGDRSAERRGRGHGAPGRGRGARRAAAPRRAGRRLPRAGRPPALRPAAVGEDELEDLAGAALIAARLRPRCANARWKIRLCEPPGRPALTLGTAGHIDHGKTALVARSPARTPTACPRSASGASPSSSASRSSSCPPARG